MLHCILKDLLEVKPPNQTNNPNHQQQQQTTLLLHIKMLKLSLMLKKYKKYIIHKKDTAEIIRANHEQIHCTQYYTLFNSILSFSVSL